MSTVHLCMYVSKCMCGSLCMPVHAGAGGGGGGQWGAVPKGCPTNPLRAQPQNSDLPQFPSLAWLGPLSLKFSWDGGETDGGVGRPPSLLSVLLAMGLCGEVHGSGCLAVPSVSPASTSAPHRRRLVGPQK